MSVPRHISRSKSLLRAFSLVEVTLALGIVAFAFTALLGMLPVGLNLFRSAADTSVTTRIVQKVSGDLQQADFDTVSLKEERILYFDEQGSPAASAAKAIYWTRVNIFPSAQLPGSEGAGSPDLARVVIQIVHNPGAIQPIVAEDGTWQEGAGLRLIMRSLLIARNIPQA